MEEELKKFMDEKGIRASDMTEEQAMEFGERIKCGKVDDCRVKKFLDGLEEKRARELKRLQAAAGRAKQRSKNRGGSSNRRGFISSRGTAVLTLMGAGLLLNAVADSVGNSVNCKRFFEGAAAGNCSHGVFESAEACELDIAVGTQEAIITLQFSLFVREYAAACAEAKTRNACCAAQNENESQSANDSRSTPSTE